MRWDEIDYIFNTLDSINKQDRELLDRTLVSIIINNSNRENSSIIANSIRKFILDDDCTDTGCSLKVFDKKITNN